MAQKHLSEDEIKYIVSAETSDAQKEVYKLTTETKKLEKEERTRRKAMIELEAQGKKNTEEYKRLQKETKEYSKSISTNKGKINELNKAMDVNALTMTSLKKRAKELQLQLDNTSKASNPQRYAETETELNRVKNRISELKGGVTQLNESVKQTSTLWDKAKMAIKGFIALRALYYLKDMVGEGINLAESADGVRRAFNALDDGTMLDNLRKATKGTVNDLSIMKAAVLAKDFMIPLEDLGKYLQFAQLKAQQTGQSVDYLTESIILGLGRKSVKILDNLGLSVIRIQQETARTGDFMKGVATIIDEELASSGNTYISAADKAQAATIRFQNAQMKLGETLLPLKENWDDAYTGIRVGLLDLINLIVKHRNVLGLLTSAISAYLIVNNLSQASTKKNIALKIIEIGIEKTKAFLLGVTRGAMLLYTAAMEALAGRTEAATLAMALFNKVTKLNPVALLASAIVAVVSAFVLFKSKTSETTKDLSELNKRLGTERFELNNIFEALKKTNPGSEKRNGLIKELKSLYPDLLSNYNLESSSLRDIAKAQNEANIALGNRIATEMKAKSTSSFVEKNISSQMDKIDYLMMEIERKMGTDIFNKFQPSIRKTLNDSKTDLTAFWNTFGKYFETTLNNDAMTDFRDAFLSLRKDQQNLAIGISDINSRYEPFLKTLRTSTKLTDEDIKRQMEEASLISKLEAQKKKVQDTWAEDTEKNISLKNREIARIDAEINKYKELGKIDVTDPNAVALKNLELNNDKRINEIKLSGREEQKTDYEIQTAVIAQENDYYLKRISLLEKFSETAKKKAKKADYQKDIVDTKTKLLDLEVEKENAAINNIKKLRDDDLASQEASYNNSLDAYNKLFENKKISQEEYDLYASTLSYDNAKKRLAIEQNYGKELNGLTVKTDSIKTKLVSETNDRILKAEKDTYNSRIKAEKAYQDNIATLQYLADKSSTSPSDRLKTEYETNKVYLESVYKASIDYANKKGEDTTTIEDAYNKAKLALDQKYYEEKNKIALDSFNKIASYSDLSGSFASMFTALDELKNAFKDISSPDFWKKNFENIAQLMSTLVNSVTSGLSNAFRTFQQIEEDNVEAKYDNEIAAAKGNSAEIERLEQEKAQKKLDIEKKYADVQFAIKAANIVANTALAIILALATLGPIAGNIAAGFIAATGAVELAAANAERNKVKNMTLSGSGSSSSSSGTRVATGRESGGYVDVTRAQDGKQFNALYDPNKRGFIDRPTVIVGEGKPGQSKEWVASNAAVENPSIAPILNIIDKAQRAGTIRTLDLNAAVAGRMAGYAAGGRISQPAPSSSSTRTDTQVVSGGLSPADARKLTDAINSLVQDGVSASVALTELEQKQQLRDRARKIGSKR